MYADLKEFKLGDSLIVCLRLFQMFMVVGKKKFMDGKVSCAPNQRAIFVDNMCRTTDSKDIEDFVSNIVNVVDFQCAAFDAAARKPFTFKVLSCDSSKELIPDV